jgi:hypothetical protein
MLSGKGCQLGYGIAMDVVAAAGMERDVNPTIPEAFFLGAGDKSDGTHYDLFYKVVDNNNYQLYIKYDVEEGQKFCGQQQLDAGKDEYDLEFTVTITSSLPLVDVAITEPTNLGQFNSQLSLVTKLSLEAMKATVDAFNMQMITGSYMSNGDEADTGLQSVPQNDEMGRAQGRYPKGDGVFLLGLFDGRQTIHVDFEDNGCRRSVGMSYTIVGRRGLASETNPAIPEAFLFGAGHAWASQGVEFKYKAHTSDENNKSNNLYWIWISIARQPGGYCDESNPVEATHQVSLKVTTSSASVDKDGTDTPPQGYQSSDSSILTMPQRSLKDISDKLDNLNKQTVVTWDANKGLDSTSNDPDAVSLGLFGVHQVVEVVVELKGCQQQFGLHTNVVARSGILVRCAFSDRNLHSRMPLDPTHVRLKRTCV